MFVAKPMNIIVEDPIMLHDRLVQMMRQATRRSTKCQEKMMSLSKSNKSNLNETGSPSPTSVVSRKVLMEDPPQNVVADLNWDYDLQLMKVAYEERGTPYHFVEKIINEISTVSP